MASLLEELYKEYKHLKTKLDQISDLILSYGGEIPDEEVRVLESSPSMDYPIHGTWKEKIVFILNELQIPSTNKEIINRLHGYEGYFNTGNELSHILTTVPQYTSNMANNNEINVDKSSGRHKYSLKKW